LAWPVVARGMIDLYQQARAAGQPRAVRPDRPAAVAEFGPPARTPVSARPFAVPGLRTNVLAHRLLEPVVNLSGKLRR
jgi:hypothetical protein